VDHGINTLLPWFRFVVVSKIAPIKEGWNIMRPALTVIELLVVIAVIGIALGLLLPAVQASRESGRQVMCRNNLRQLGLAVHSFEATHRVLPSNGWGYRWIYDPKRGVGVQQPGGWIAQIAPFAEFTHASGEAGPLMDHEARTAINRSDWHLMHCPSRPGGFSLASTSASPVNAAFSALVGKTDYAANEGDFITDTDGGPKSLVEGDSRDYMWKSTERASGVIYLRSHVRMSDVFDGTSQTYLCGEKYVSVSHYNDDGDRGYDQSMFSGVDLDLNRWVVGPPKHDGRTMEVRRFGSAHASACNMVHCDGSVRPVSYDVDSEVHRAYGNRRDSK
jgi:hypothetical protein